jgi:HlyD family secretion protein
MKKKIIIILAIVLIIFMVGFIFKSGDKKGDIVIKFTEIKRGDIKNLVSSTGTISSVDTVDVGSQVSGIVKKISVDFNDLVKKGQILAVLDKTLFKVAVNDAEARMVRAKAILSQAEAEVRRNRPLFEKGHISEMEFIVTKTTLKIAKADLKVAEALLNKSKTNLNYTVIRSPIDGIVIERMVDEGQTIAATFQAPRLFVIAKDLKKMQIETNVDESDIGQIKEGQSVEFTVQAYIDDLFTGKVQQIRLQPQTIQNVVNYTVIVDAYNVNGLLLPGMTATVDFIVEERKNVLLFPNAALNIKPPVEFINKLSNQMKNRKRENVQENFSGDFNSIRKMFLEKPDRKIGCFFYRGEDGDIRIGTFIKGATDGKKTEILESNVLTEGAMVVLSFKNGENSSSKSNKSFLMPPPPGR